VTFPNGETRRLAPGPSSIISKAVIEDFSKRFLDQPAILWLSKSGNKVVARDDEVASAIGLTIEPDKNLPDLILADLGPTEPLLVFVEVVATDGAITARRQEAILAMTDAAGFVRSQVAFLTAYQDRESAGFKRTVAGLAWNSFAWFVSEPDKIVIFRNGGKSAARLSDLLAV
jgi:BsuBI/PstI restriction endonuclease